MTVVPGAAGASVARSVGVVVVVVVVVAAAAAAAASSAALLASVAMSRSYMFMILNPGVPGVGQYVVTKSLRRMRITGGEGQGRDSPERDFHLFRVGLEIAPLGLQSIRT